MAVYFKIIIERNRGVCLIFPPCYLLQGFVLVPFNSQTAMCMLLSRFFNILILNSSSVHGYCVEPVIFFCLYFSSIDPYIFAR